MMKFQAIAQPTTEQIKAAARLSPDNPFCSYAYVQARMTAQRCVPYLLEVREGTTLVAGCIAFWYEHRWVRTFEIESLPILSQNEDVFWDGLLAFCRSQKVTVLSVNSYASEAARIPPIQSEITRRQRTEHILDLQEPEESRRLSSQHRRNLKRARKAELIVRSTTSDEAMRVHVELMTSSLERRQARGEQVKIDEETWRRNVSFLRSGAGEIFQALQDGEVISSILILTSETGGYYHSAGTSAAGRSCGASPFLIEQVRHTLQERGFERFSLGGAERSEAGLYRFKSQFGGREVPLEAGRFHLGNPWIKKLRSLARTIRDEPLSIHKSLLSADRFVAYTIAPEAGEPIAFDEGIACTRLGDEELLDLPAEFEEQVEHFRQLQFNDAYVVRYNGQVAHVAWLVSPEHEQLSRYHNVALRPGEAEITHCQTASNFRGQGFYPLAIRYLCQAAARENIRKIYMITNINNEASQRGIEKAGLRRCGTILRFQYPWLPSFSGPVIRTHRWPTRSPRKTAEALGRIGK